MILIRFFFFEKHPLKLIAVFVSELKHIYFNVLTGFYTDTMCAIRTICILFM